MAIPDFQTLMFPLLQLTADGQEHSIHEFVDTLAKQFSLTPQDLAELLPSGKQPKFYNRVGWTRTHLSKAGLLETTRRSYYRITDRGREVLKEKPTRIDMKYLRKFPEYVEFKDGANGHTDPQGMPDPVESNATPEELLEDAYQLIRENLASELLVQVKGGSPAFFERLVVEVLVKMGYGGSHREAARAVGQTGDEGVDGIIDEDRLGLDAIYIQAKRWDSVVGRPEIQKFVGALMGKRARKGIFITTSTFSNEAKSYVNNIDSKVVLIDGRRLADLMIDYDVGVAQVTSYQIKRIDSDYFGVS
jgi:restriction system protein